jgi:hypothetical protein
MEMPLLYVLFVMILTERSLGASGNWLVTEKSVRNHDSRLAQLEKTAIAAALRAAMSQRILPKGRQMGCCQHKILVPTVFNRLEQVTPWLSPREKQRPRNAVCAALMML